MASDRVEQQLERLRALRALGPADEVIAALRKALGDRVNVVVAKAAAISAELQIRTLLPDLLHAFERLFDKPLESDPQCWGKNAIAKALKDLGHAESTAFLRGMRHIQTEPIADAYRKSRGARSLRHRRHVNHSWAVPDDSKYTL